MNKIVPTGMDLKLTNRNNIYKIIWQEKRISKQNIMKLLNLSLPTVTQNLNDLCDEGLVTVNGSFGYTGGRSAAGYSIVAEARYAVGIDLSRSNITIIIMDINGNIVGSSHEKREFENDVEYYRYIANCLDRIMTKTYVTEEKLLGIGISMQGLISKDRKEVVYGPILGTKGIQAAQIAEFIPYPCELFHNAYSAAFAELWVSPEIRNAVYITLGMNLGGALIVNRKIFYGDNYMAGQIEHMTLMPGGKECYCGKKGCADAYCNASILSNIAMDNTLNTFFNMLKAGHTQAVKTWELYLEHIAVLLNNVHMLLDTDIILGGYLASNIGAYLEVLKQKAYVRNSVDERRDYIKLSQYLNDSSATGSALYYIDQFINNV